VGGLCGARIHPHIPRTLSHVAHGEEALVEKHCDAQEVEEQAESRQTHADLWRE
jgi:hypothetical protein